MRIAFVTSRFPFPVEKGDKLRAFHQIRILSQSHEIHLVSISHKRIRQEDLDAMSPYCKSVKVFHLKWWLMPVNLLIGLLEGLPLQVSYFLDRVRKRQIQYHIINIEPDHVICQLIRAADYVRALPFAKTLDYMDVFSEGMRQMSEKYPWLGWIFSTESKRLAAYERTLYKDFDRHIIISEQDRDRLKLPSKEHIAVIPNGVDQTYFHDEDLHKASHDLVFVGNLGYGPNKAAVEFLVNEVMPELALKNRNVRLLIAGARPGRKITRLQQKNKRVTVKGWVYDIREAYRDGRIFVAPMFSGLGLQNKILEAMSMKLPCITTSMVNNAIQAVPGEEILIADSVSQMVNDIIFLLDNPRDYERIAANGKHFVKTHFRWEDQGKKMEDVIHSKSAYYVK